MKSKNTFKKPVITYDPIVQEKQPLWMNTVQSSRTSKTIIGEALLLVAIFAAIVLVWGVLA
jgi:hypothetical protein